MTDPAQWDRGEWDNSYWDVEQAIFRRVPRKKRREPKVKKGPPVPHPPAPRELMVLLHECLETEVFES